MLLICVTENTPSPLQRQMVNTVQRYNICCEILRNAQTVWAELRVHQYSCTWYIRSSHSDFIPLECNFNLVHEGQLLKWHKMLHNIVTRISEPSYTYCYPQYFRRLCPPPERPSFTVFKHLSFLLWWLRSSDTKHRVCVLRFSEVPLIRR